MYAVGGPAIDGELRNLARALGVREQTPSPKREVRRGTVDRRVMDRAYRALRSRWGQRVGERARG